MEEAETIVPLRPGFDIQLRGFSRNQVMEHIELLEDQLKLVTVDRNEAVALTADLRRLYDDARSNLAQAEHQLRRIESSDTGLPAASQRVQNMLAMAEEEVQELREQAARHAETIRGKAATEAAQLIADAENTAQELRKDCASLISEIHAKKEELQRTHSANIRELRSREQQMRQAIRNAYKAMIAQAEDEATQLIARAHRHCAEREAQMEQHRQETMEALEQQRIKLAKLSTHVLSALDNARGAISADLHTAWSTAPTLSIPHQDQQPQDDLIDSAEVVALSTATELRNGLNGHSPEQAREFESRESYSWEVGGPARAGETQSTQDDSAFQEAASSHDKQASVSEKWDGAQTFTIPLESNGLTDVSQESGRQTGAEATQETFAESATSDRTSS